MSEFGLKGYTLHFLNESWFEKLSLNFVQVKVQKLSSNIAKWKWGSWFKM